MRQETSNEGTSALLKQNWQQTRQSCSLLALAGGVQSKKDCQSLQQAGLKRHVQGKTGGTASHQLSQRQNSVTE